MPEARLLDPNAVELVAVALLLNPTALDQVADALLLDPTFVLVVGKLITPLNEASVALMEPINETSLKKVIPEPFVS